MILFCCRHWKKKKKKKSEKHQGAVSQLLANLKKKLFCSVERVTPLLELAKGLMTIGLYLLSLFEVKSL